MPGMTGGAADSVASAWRAMNNGVPDPDRAT
jgi:hypothetical protein